MVDVAVIDDDLCDAQKLKDYISRYDAENNAEARYRIAVFGSGDEFVDSGDMPRYAAVFLDIDMPGLNGMQAAARLREANPDVCIVFITNMAQYAIDGYKVDALDFVLKPIEYYDFAIKMKKVERYLEKFADRTVAICGAGGETVRLKVSEITYIEVFQHYITYHTVRGDYTARGTISEAEKIFSAYNFFRVSKSFLVNMNHVSLVKGRECVVGGDAIVVSRQKREQFKHMFLRYVGNGGKNLARSDK